MDGVISLKRSKRSIKSKVWLYLITFALLILLFLWLFQVIFLNQFYLYYKTKDVEKTGEKIVSLYETKDEFINEINNLNIREAMCIEIIDEENNSSYTSTNMNKVCSLRNERLNKYKEEFILSDQNKTLYKIKIRDGIYTILYCHKLNDGSYMFLNASLNPTNSTVRILAYQLGIVTIIVLLLAALFSYILSKILTKDIIRLNDSANDMAKGNYNVVFPNSDIKEINELAETLNYAKDELQKTDNLRKDLIANVSHDLKTPLTMIRAYAEMVRDITYKDDKKREENLNIIINEVDRLNLLVSDILDLSRIQSDINELEYSEFDIISTCNEIINRFEIFAEKEKYSFEFKHKDKEIIIKADKKKLEQVIYNLIGNAINYAGKDKKVIVTIKKEKDGIHVEVKDNGKGIDPEEIKYIWDKYYKNDKNHKRNVVGTGLGLSICKNILEKHKYKYGINSIKGKGSTFYFIIK